MGEVGWKDILKQHILPQRVGHKGLSCDKYHMPQTSEKRYRDNSIGEIVRILFGRTFIFNVDFLW